MTFTNPVYGDNFADPQVVAVANTYYAFVSTRPRPSRHVLHKF
jgi:hypothetical protein